MSVYDMDIYYFIMLYANFFLNFQITIKSIDEIDLLREQQNILSGEVALHSSALKRLSQEAARNSQKDEIYVGYYLKTDVCLCD